MLENPELIGERGEEEANPLGLYEGERNEKGDRHGRGKALLPNGDMYVGQYCKGLRHARGLYVFKNGARYDGEWRQGVKYGQGTFWYPDGTRYEGEWKRDTKYGFGVYYYINGDVYEGSWKKNLRHGMGSYLYASTNTKFMGTWIKDRMQGPGQLIHPRHRFHGFWELNLPYGRGCFTFENACMQHGHYVHVKDPDYDETKEIAEEVVEPPSPEPTAVETEAETDVTGTEITKPEVKPKPFEAPRLKKGIIALWRARCITPYNPDLLPPEPVPLQEEISVDSLIDKCSEDLSIAPEQFLKYEDEYEGEGEIYYEEDYPIPSPKLT
ncbi:radial spoke head 1 homolog isoform X2 [Apis mellifera]|uniref:Radial spoke head 1 homolog isoform X2 n=1 Tax=Apis mellifera TaxID=7460 RepID=A0A7M7MNJ8_APIME|nr:radial spoke head 1 homolog isoform X2 [Apis mellifera]|eukprot:XP_026298638.1 radial spoke head 1 homolog isoform X2 [Apis mellifera]